MTRRTEIQVVRNGKAERYRPRGVAGEHTIYADPLDEEPPVIPPAPPYVWLVYKRGGAYRGDGLQGIYSSEEGAMDSVRFQVKDERRSLARRLGQPENPHDAEEPVLTWQPVHHERYGPIPGEFYAEAGLANFTVKRYAVPEGYLLATKWCIVPHVTEVRG